MARRLWILAAYCVIYPLVSLVLVVAASGMGEGSTLPISAIGSPFTTVSDIGLLAVLPGLVLGYLLIFDHRRAAAVWLLIHYIGIPLAIRRLDPGEYQLQRLRDSGGGVLALTMFYLLGNIFAWLIVLRGDRPAATVES